MEGYSAYIAHHYKAYRPPLHKVILDKCLGKSSYSTALDVGCGTGQSSIALSAFCDTVIGVDSSDYMLDNALKHPKVLYQSTDVSLDFTFDLVCYFGSLNYVKKAQLINHINHLKSGGRIICCDFKLLLDSIFEKFNIIPKASGYNHKKNLSFYPLSSVQLTKTSTQLDHFSCTLEELAHLLLSEMSLLTIFQSKFGEDPYNELVNQLAIIYPTKIVWITAISYFSSYQTFK